MASIRRGFHRSGAPPSADDERALVHHAWPNLSPRGARAFRQPPLWAVANLLSSITILEPLVSGQLPAGISGKLGARLDAKKNLVLATVALSFVFSN